MMIRKGRRLRLLGDPNEMDDVCSSTQYGHLVSEDMILKVLHHLPTKSLFRFRYVSKRWFNLISSPVQRDSCRSNRWVLSPSLCGYFFQDTHRRTNGQFLFTHIEGKKSKCTLDRSLSFLEQFVIVKGSANGFLLCSRNREYPMRYYVCNPFTRQWVALPKPSKCHQLVSVGFDCKINEECSDLVQYTVLRCSVPWTVEASLPVEVFSSVTGKWKIIILEVEMPFFKAGYIKWGTVIDGVFYLLDSCKIIACDMKAARCWVMDLPEIDFLDSRSNCLGGSNSLHYGFVAGQKIEIFVLGKNHGNCVWRWKHSVCVRTLVEVHPEIWPRVHDKYSILLTGFHPSNPNIIFFIVLRKMISYDIDSGKLEVHYVFGLPWSLRIRNLTFFPIEWLEWPRTL